MRYIQLIDRELAERLEDSYQAKSISDFYQVGSLGKVKDYKALEHGDGYILSDRMFPVGAVHTKADAKKINLLEFAPNQPRGNHYHKRNTEYLIVLKGKLTCRLFLPENPDEIEELVLESGQQIRISPGCAHTYIGSDGNVYALEYATHRYKASDVIDVPRTFE